MLSRSRNCRHSKWSFLDNVIYSIIKATLKYRNHPNIVTIRNQCKNRDSFRFTEVGKREVEHFILNQGVSKVSQSSVEQWFFRDFLCTSFNNSINLTKFPPPKKNLKLADIKPLHRKDEKDIKGNCRPVTILPNLSKIFEKCIFTQMSQFLNNIFSKYTNMVSEEL